MVSLSLTAEFMGIDSENDLFRKLPKTISSKIERSVYNRRRRKLVNHIDSIWLKLASYFNEFKTYYGYKLHAVCSVNGVFQSIDLSPASVHDVNYLKEIRSQISDCTLIGDRGYLSVEIQLNLFETCNIK